MARWQAKIKGNPSKQIEIVVKAAWQKTLSDLSVWMSTELVKSLVYGGLGVQGIAQTDFYKFITSPEGLSQLGIPPTEPPKLLKAYETSAFKVKKTGDVLSLNFGDVAALKAATKHPASGTGNLHIESWLEWIVDQKTVNRGFVPRERLKPSAQKAVRLSQPLGGLMLPRGAYGSTGLWRFPETLAGFEQKWVSQNSDRIQDLITEKMTELLSKNING